MALGLRYDEIAEILKIIDGSSCDEVIVETDDIKLVVRRNGAGGGPVPSADAAKPASTPAPIVAPPLRAPAPAPSEAGTASPRVERALHEIEVVAPMVGTFYRSPSPDAAPFVENGDTIRKGAALCVIEVMKLFTTITSEHDGRVMQIGAENGELVEYGRTLFVIEPA